MVRLISPIRHFKEGKREERIVIFLKARRAVLNDSIEVEFITVCWSWFHSEF